MSTNRPNVCELKIVADEHVQPTSSSSCYHRRLSLSLPLLPTPKLAILRGADFALLSTPIPTPRPQLAQHASRAWDFHSCCVLPLGKVPAPGVPRLCSVVTCVFVFLYLRLRLATGSRIDPPATRTGTGTRRNRSGRPGENRNRETEPRESRTRKFLELEMEMKTLGAEGGEQYAEYLSGILPGRMSGLCRDYIGILSDRMSVLRRGYVGGYVGLYGGYVGSQGKPR